jgi:hypothetical protein
MRKTQVVEETAGGDTGIYLTSLPTFGSTDDLCNGLIGLVTEVISEVEEEVLGALGKVYSIKQVTTITAAFSKLSDSVSKEVRADCLQLVDEIEQDIAGIRL